VCVTVGLKGGSCAQRGLNLLHICETALGDDSATATAPAKGTVMRTVSLGGKNSVQVGRHDRITIYTPGGGGYGPLAASSLVAAVGEEHRSSEGGAGNSGEGSGGKEERSSVVVRPVKTSGSLHTYTANQESA
jgi:N-methylhydantoinase B/oxoprolinase/acetone carboxylase alpha subunit